MLNQYIAELSQIYKAGNATEHSYRPALQRLLENITQGLNITNEPKRIACGAPDYIVTRKEIPIGYIEAKDIGVDLNGRANKEQFERYKQSLNNLIITDYLTFQLFKDGGQVASATIGKASSNGVEADATQVEAFAEMVNLFAGYQGQNIRTSEHLSKIMAAKARLMANIIEQTLDDNEKGDSNSLDGQLEGFREVLIPNTTHREFADIYAQTIAYGMFAARLNDEISGDFSRSKAAQFIPQSNPFLRKLFQYIAGYDLDDRIRWVVDDLADLFNYVDINKILQEFGKVDHDPMIHFYETFLAEYDPALRKSRGVWYTPQPVVQFIVQAVDDILKQEFDLPQGLADTSKVQIKQDGEQKECHKVQILDPATGTGTFLAEVVRNIYQRFKDQQGLWSGYASEHLIPRINGFEILMASYAMAHLKLDMLLQKTGYKSISNERLRIYLTNSLEEAHARTEIPFAKWLSDEANEASRIKQEVPVMVVLGNPPYSVSSQNRGEWIQTLLNDYKEELHEKKLNLDDDYIKFIRYGHNFIDKNGSGILAYISNNSFIDGVTHRQMRKCLLESFDKIYILNLHGNARKKETIPDGGKDENVFDIMQGVSINIFVKTKQKKKGKLAQVSHYDLYGKRAEKYSFLLNNNLASVAWKELSLNAPYYFFVPKNFANKADYETGFKITDLFNVYNNGIKTDRDLLFIDMDSNILAHRIKKLLSGSYEQHFKDTLNINDSSSYKLTEVIQNKTLSVNNIQTIMYRPFDTRAVYYQQGITSRPAYNVMQHFIGKPNIGLVLTRTFPQNQNFNRVFVCNTMADIHFISDQSYIFPLYLYSDNNLFENKKRWTPNFNMQIVNTVAQNIQLQFVDERDGDGTFAPLDLMDYIYAVLHSPAYRERYKEFLKIDFPRVPYPQDTAQFRALATLGAKLRRLHLLENVEPLQGVATYPKEGSNVVEALHATPLHTTSQLRVWINDTQYFDNVPSVAWEFYIGGYQPAQKWLKDRKGRVLNYDEILHYQRIIAVLLGTEEVMGEIDGKKLRK
jgi:predicted helicase